MMILLIIGSAIFFACLIHFSNNDNSSYLYIEKSDFSAQDSMDEEAYYGYYETEEYIKNNKYRPMTPRKIVERTMETEFESNRFISMCEEDYYNYYENMGQTKELSFSPKAIKKPVPFIPKEEPVSTHFSSNTQIIDHILEKWLAMKKKFYYLLTSEEKYLLEEQMPRDLKNLFYSYENLDSTLKEKHHSIFVDTIASLLQKSMDIQLKVNKRLENQFIEQVRKVEVKM